MQTETTSRIRSQWHTCRQCGQKFYYYVDFRSTGTTGYCSQKCEREAVA